MRWNSHSVLFTGTCSIARCQAFDSSAIALCRASHMARTLGRAELKHTTTPITACKSFRLFNLFSLSECCLGDSTSQVFGTWRIYGRIRLSISCAREPSRIDWSSFLLRKTRPFIIRMVNTYSFWLKKFEPLFAACTY